MQPGVSGDTHAHTARARRTWSSLVLGGLVLAAVLSTRWVRLNLSPSVPYGLYRLTAIGAPLARDTLVILPVPARAGPGSRLDPVAETDGWIAWGRCVSSGSHAVYEWHVYGPVYQEAHGHPLPQPGAGCLQCQRRMSSSPALPLESGWSLPGHTPVRAYRCRHPF